MKQKIQNQSIIKLIACYHNHVFKCHSLSVLVKHPSYLDNVLRLAVLHVVKSNGPELHLRFISKQPEAGNYHRKCGLAPYNDILRQHMGTFRLLFYIKTQIQVLCTAL